MAEITLYIAASIDGHIAQTDGSVDWLENIPNPEKSDYGYAEFLEGIDTVVMGRKTYEQVKGFDMEWPYGHLHTVVVSSDRSLPTGTPNTSILSTLTRSAVEQLRSESSKGIWLVGGGHLVQAFLKLSAIDQLILFFMPVVLGNGLPLFPGGSKPTELHLVSAHHYVSGVVRLEYRTGHHSTNESL